MPIKEVDVLEALKSVMDPDLHRDIVTLGFVKNVVITLPKVAFQIDLTTPACPVKELLKSQAEECVLALDGVSGVSESGGKIVVYVSEDSPALREQILAIARDAKIVVTGKFET